MVVEPVTLEGQSVRLEPMRLEHWEGLHEAGADESLWKWTTLAVRTADGMKRYIETALEEQQRGMALPFVTVAKSAGRIIGSTRFGNISIPHRRVEIGWTWINPAWQRTSVNTEAKLLMLEHAFEAWNCIRVELRTDALNEKSRRAIGRLGAVEEGTLRRHLITDTGRIRDTIVFSILDSEWARVSENLRSKLARQT